MIVADIISAEPLTTQDGNIEFRVRFRDGTSAHLTLRESIDYAIALENTRSGPSSRRDHFRLTAEGILAEAARRSALLSATGREAQS